MKLKKYQLLFLFLSLQILSSLQATTISSAGVEISPSTIKSTSVLKVYAVIKTTIPANGFIVVVFPSTITTTPSTACTFTSPSSATATCSYTTVSGQIQLTAKVSTSISDYFELNLPSFQNPSTTAQTTTFQVYTQDTSQTILDQQTSSIYLQATTDSLSSVSLSSNNTRVGASPSILTVTISIKNALTTSGFVKISFPYWNPDASSTSYALQSYMYSTSSVACVGKTNVKTSPTCSFDTSTQTLTMTNAFSSSISSGQTISFEVHYIKNPITPSTTSGFTVYTGSSDDGGSIDSGSGTLTVSSIALITTSASSVDTTVVQEKTKYRVQFTVPVPLSSGCILEIQFPSQITLDSSILTTIEAFGLPSTQRTMTGSIDTNSNSYIFTNACPSYRDNTNPAIVYFTNIQNPSYVMTTDTIEVYISDSSGQMICSTSGSGPTISTTQGSINVKSLISDNYEVNSQATVTFYIQPVHELAASSKLILNLPSTLVVGSTCTLTSLNLLSSSAECTTSGNTVTITSSLSSDYTYSSTEYIEFKLSYLTMPPSTATTGTYEFWAYTFDSGFQLVDYGSSTNLIQATSALLSSVSITPSSYVSYTVTSYTFAVTTKNPILQGGYLIITIPTSDLSFSSASCISFSGFVSTPSCTFGTSTVKVSSGFTSNAQTSTSTTLSIAVSGILNPRSMKTTGTFQVKTYDSSGNIIDYKTEGLTVTMTDTKSISYGYAYPNSYTVGIKTTYMIVLTASVPVYSGDTVYLVFPSEVGSPISATLSKCYGIKNMQYSMSCSSTGTYGVTLSTSMSPSPLSAGNQFSFNVGNVINPDTTEYTSMFSAYMYDSSGYQIQKMDTSLANFKIKMTIGAKFTSISVAHGSSIANDTTTVTFTFQLVNDLPASAKIQIKYPSQMSVDEDQFACIVSNLGSQPTCTVDTEDRYIYLSSVTSYTIQSGTWYTVTIYGMINSKYAKATDSFQIETLTSSGNQINYADSDLTLTNECDFPCLTCFSNDTSKCLTCNITSTYSLLLNNQCLQSCPSNYYAESYQCQKCDSLCKECQVGGSKCTKCYTGMYLQGNTCVDKCDPDVYIQNSKTQNCDTCVSPCATCTTTTSTCNSCLQVNYNPLKYLYGNSCLAQCPVLTTVAVDGKCENCNSNCKTCSGLTTVCTSCADGLKLDYTDMTCKSSCPVGTTVDEGDKCTPCDSSCKTCASSNASYCLSCQYSLNFWETQHQCLLQCPNGTVQITTNSVGYCKECNEGCTTCQNRTDYCTKCDSTHLFYKFTCVTSCPSGYARLSNERNICVKERFDCPYGYEYDDYGECQLVVQKCKEGFVLNWDKTHCIPVPGAYVPLIFLIACGGWTLFIVLKYRKIFDKITIITQLLIFYTPVQTLTYVVMFCLSISLEYMMIEAIHLITLFGMLFANIGWFFIYHYKLRKQDSAYKHWVDQNKRVYVIVRYVSLSWNFKSVRMMYSNFLKKECFNGAFESKYKTLIKPLFILSVVNFVIQVMPIILMDIYNLIFIPWGYQIEVMSIDNMILAIVIFVLEIIEFRHYKKLYIEEEGGVHLYHETSSAQFLKMNQQVNVMSVMDDSSMMGLNKLKEYTEIMANDANESHGPLDKKKEVGKPKKTKEVEFLENLIKRLKNESKFNQINNEEDSMATPYPDDIENPMQGLDHINDHGVISNHKAKKMKIESTREKFENNLSFRINNMTQAMLLKQKALTQAHRAVFGDGQTPGITRGGQALQTLGGDPTMIIEEENAVTVNMESARTEKFTYQELTKDGKEIDKADGKESQKEHQPTNKGQSLSPKATKIPPLNITEGLANLEQIERDKREYSKFYEEFKQELDNHQRQFEIYHRDWHSFDENIMREWYDDMERESDFHSELSRETYPHNPHQLKNAVYLARLELFRENMKAFYQYNNLYSQQQEVEKKNPNNKNVTRRTQTYEKDMAVGYDPFEKDEDLFQFDDDRVLELDPDFTPDLINRLIERLSEEESFIENQELQDNDKESDDTDFDYEKNKSKKRQRDVQFDIDDIMGMFDIDDYGNIMLNQESMRDNLNRKVNKHGYLIDQKKNIINQEGDIIFEVEELNSDEELPMPYRFEKRKKQLLKQEDKFQIDQEIQTQKNFDLDSLVQNEDDKVELEFQKLKDISRPSSVDSLIGNLPINIDKQDLSQHSQDGIEPEDLNLPVSDRKKSPENKRELALAKAYGGKPPQKKKKKKSLKKRSQMNQEGEDGRLPTDRLFPSLLQEEERVKRMAKVAYNKEEQKQGGQTVGFEDFFKKQMNEIQQYRFQAREDFQNMPQFFDDPSQAQTAFEQQNELRHQDSVSTHKSIKNFWTDNVNRQPFIATASPIADNHHDFASAGDLMAKPSYINKNPSSFTNYAQAPQYNQMVMYQTQKSESNKRQQPWGSQTHQQRIPTFYQNPQSVMSMNTTSQQAIEEVKNESFIDEPQNQVPLFRKFDFYLPGQQQQARLKKNLEKGRDVSFKDVGMMQIEGESKIKGLEKVYLQKYPQREQKTVNPINQNSLIYSSLSKKKRGPNMRNIDGNNTMDNDPRANRFNQSELQMITNLNTANIGGMGAGDIASDNVFDGVASVLNNIDRLRTNEKLQTNNEQRRTQMLSSGSAQQAVRNNIMTQNNNWI